VVDGKKREASPHVRFLRHVDVAVRLLRLILDGKETALDFLEHGGIVINHAAIQADFHGSIGDQQVLTLMAVEILDATLFMPVAATEIAFLFGHSGPPDIRV
jgi:hypothetical protein